MSSIFDFEDKSSLDPIFPVPDEAQFTDDDEMEPGTKEKYAVRGDMKVHAFRGSADAGTAGRHVINLNVEFVNNDYYDGRGEQTWWFDEDTFEGQWGHISKKQVLALCKLALAMGIVTEDAINLYDASTSEGCLDIVELLIAASEKYNPNTEYTFGGMLQFVKTKKDDGRVYMNTNLYLNTFPKAEVPF